MAARTKPGRAARRLPRYSAAAAATWLVLGLLAVSSGATETEPCPELAAYAAQSHATDAGIRRRCGLLRVIDEDGHSLPGALRTRIVEELSNRFAVELKFEGRVGLSNRAVDYLIENMPETAALVSVYTDQQYAATATDATPGPQSFFVTDTRSFAADFTFLRSQTAPTNSEYTFFETGHATVFFWRIWGNSMVQYVLRQDEPGTSRYRITAHVFTDSRIVSGILGSGVFAYFARRKFDDILDGIEASVHEFSRDDNPENRLPVYFVHGLRDALGLTSTPLEAR